MLQAAEEKGEVGPLRAVEGVHLVDYKEAQRLGLVLLPERLVAAPQQQVVEHLVVGQQDVGRVRPHGGAPRDHVLFGHRVGGDFGSASA